VCRVVRFIPFKVKKVVRISATLSEMSDGLITMFKCSNSTSL
jgi:hypothetical protein